jgi:predicted house-cleaning noncanonical NTP pyrophosphatase (MazG superfamily)
MRKFKFGKLVRDGIRPSIEGNGAKANWHKLAAADFISELKLKLVEEAQELQSAPDEKLLNELGDLQEVLSTLLEAIGKTQAELEGQIAKRQSEVGGFKEREYIDTVEVPDDPAAYPYTNYYLANPDKYPEITDEPQQ